MATTQELRDFFRTQNMLRGASLSRWVEEVINKGRPVDMCLMRCKVWCDRNGVDYDKVDVRKALEEVSNEDCKDTIK